MKFRAIALCVVVTVFTSVTRASITAFWLPVASGDGSVGTMYPAAAVADDPQLASMQTWDLMVTTSGDWVQGNMRAAFEPGGGVWYHHPLGGNTRPDPAVVDDHPALAYDTYVTAPLDDGTANAPLILGGFPGGALAIFGENGVFAVSWGNLQVDPPGTYTIARWTFPVGALPRVFWDGDPPVLPDSSNVVQLDPDVTVIIPQIPEPCLSITPLAIAALTTRPKRKVPDSQCKSC